MTEQYLTASEAAERIGCSIASVYNWCYRGKYNHENYGKRGILIPASEVKRMQSDFRKWRADVERRKRQSQKQQTAVARRKAKKK